MILGSSCESPLENCLVHSVYTSSTKEYALVQLKSFLKDSSSSTLSCI